VRGSADANGFERLPGRIEVEGAIPVETVESDRAARTRRAEEPRS